MIGYEWPGNSRSDEASEVEQQSEDCTRIPNCTEEASKPMQHTKATK